MEINSRKHIHDVGMISLGNFVMSFAYAKFMVPHKIINGGVTSLSMIVTKFILVRIDLINTLLLLGLLVLTTLFLGRELLIKSIVSSITYSIFFTFFINLPLIIHLSAVPSLLIASLLIAFGYFCCLSSNASTVGMDVIALIIFKYNQKISLAKLIRFLNFFILGFGLFIYGIQSVILGLIFTYIYSFELNLLFGYFKEK
ncbi:YitT family protein [Enterococcus sp. AZ196]|uniref:YitT family protein n=1 Tax=Enterococcus sp. AZ196 TaxID=2774659 RepID=UPI003D272C39